jgi:hypothetical protein
MAMQPLIEKRLIVSKLEGVTSKFVDSGEVRRCESCLVQYPLDQFRRRHRGRDQRVNQCRLCHNELERYRRAAIRHRVSRREMAKAMTQFKNSTAAARVPAFCGEMVQHFGGADRFLDAWKACIDQDLEKGGLPAFRHIAMLLKFMEYCEPRPVDYSLMSDEELLDRLQKHGRIF